MAILFMGNTSSECGWCHRPAYPHEGGHYTQAGYKYRGHKGCEAEWTSVVLVYPVTGHSLETMAYSLGERFPNLVGLPLREALFEDKQLIVIPGQLPLDFE